MVLRIIKNEEDAREIILDVFLKLWQKKEFLKEVASPSAWLYRIASNRALDYLRKNNVGPKVHYGLSDDLDVQGEDLHSHIDAAQLQKLIHEAKEKLPTSRRQIFILSREEGLSRSEIASQMGISESTVKNQLTSSLKFVQDYISLHTGKYIPVVLLLFIK